jgi:hypothetical protein
MKGTDRQNKAQQQRREAYIEAKIGYFETMEEEKKEAVDANYEPLFKKLLKDYPPKNYNRDD